MVLMTVLVTKNTTNNTMYSVQEPCLQSLNETSLTINCFIFINIFTAFFY